MPLEATTNDSQLQPLFLVDRIALREQALADEKNNFDLSPSRYKEDVFEEVQYDPPGVILDRLIQAEVGDVEETELAKVASGIVRELLELRGWWDERRGFHFQLVDQQHSGHPQQACGTGGPCGECQPHPAQLAYWLLHR